MVGGEMIRRKMGSTRLVVKGRYSNWERITLPPQLVHDMREVGANAHTDKYIDEEPPHYVDRLFHIRKFVEAWNYKISTNFIPCCISCLDK